MKNLLEGYATSWSVEAGDQLRLHVSTDRLRYSVEIARSGWRHEPVWSRQDLPGKQHPVPKDASTHGCGWPAEISLTVPRGWKSGYYDVLLSAVGSDGNRLQSHAFFVIRPFRPGQDADILMPLSTYTSNAYNRWGGSSFYRGPYGPARRLSFERPYAGLPGVDAPRFFSLEEKFEQHLTPGLLNTPFRNQIDELIAEHGVPGIRLSERARVAVDDPGRRWRIIDLLGQGPANLIIKKREKRLDVHDGTTAWECGWHKWQQPFVSWAEREGYRIDFATSADLEFRPEILQKYRLVVSVGHDEYWSSPMRDHLEAFIANGGNVAFLSGNTAYWQVRTEDQGRALLCWKDDFEQDPIFASGDHRLLTTLWCHRLIGRPENQLTGVSFAYGGYSRYFDQFPDASGAFTIHKPEHWLFEGTGLQAGDQLGIHDHIVTYECDGCELHWERGIPRPTHGDGTPRTFQVLGAAPAGLTDFDGSLAMISEALYGKESGRLVTQPGAAVFGLYRQGGTVVTSGCTHWSCGLRGGDPAIEQITRNLLDKLSG